MNDCDAIRDELKAYADGELSWGSRRAVRQHLSRCAACEEEAAMMEKIGSHLRTQDVGGMSPALRSRILAGLPDRAPANAPSRPRRLSHRAVLGWAAAGMAVLGVVVVYNMSARESWAPTASLKQEMAKSANTGAAARSEPMVVANAPSAPASMPAAASGGPKVAESPALPSPMRYSQDYDEAANRQGADRPEAAFGGQPPSGGAVAGSAAPLANAAGEEQRAESSVAHRVASAEAARSKDSQDKWYLDGHAKTRSATAPVARPTLPAARVDVNGRNVAEITLVVDAVESKSDAVEGLAKKAGGFVSRSRMAAGTDGLKSSSLTVRVPVSRFDALVKDVSKLGDVKARSVSSGDATAQHKSQPQTSTAKKEVDNRQSASEAIRNTKGTPARWRTTVEPRKTVANERAPASQKPPQFATITVQLKEKAKTVTPRTGGFLDDLSSMATSAGDAFLRAVRLPILLILWLLAYTPVWLPLVLLGRLGVRTYRRRMAGHGQFAWPMGG